MIENSSGLLPATPNDIFGTEKRQKSISRDAQFWPEIRDARERRLTSALEGSSVEDTISPPALTPQAPPATPLPSTASLTSRFDAYMQSRPRAFLHKHTKPAPWRDLTFTLQALYLHDAAGDLGEVHAFTLFLDQPVDELLRQKASAASDLQKRIARQLQKEIGRRVDFWFVLENAKTGGRGLHAHGELVLPAGELEAARRALRRAGGEWRDTRQHQTKTVADPNPGWIAYVLKDDVWTRKPKRNAGRISRTLDGLRKFSGANHGSTRDLQAAAGRLYDLDRVAALV